MLIYSFNQCYKATIIITFENNIAIVTVCFQVLAIKTRELNSVQSDCSARSNQLENKHAQELTAEREKSLQVL